MIVEATRVITSQGQYAGETGTGYCWGTKEMGDFSHETRGRIQGRHEPCRIEVLVEGGELVDCEGYGLLLWLPRFLHEDALTADEVLALNYARVIE